MTAGTLALWIAAAFALGALAGSARPGPEATRLLDGRRALTAAGVFAATALVLLARDLLAADLQVGFVARQVITAMPARARLLSMLGEPAGAGLVASVATALGTLPFTRHSDRRAPIMASAAVTLICLAAPLTGRPHALLSWLPADGQPQTLYALHALAVPYALALPALVLAALVVLTRVLEERDPVPAARVATALVATLAITWFELSTRAGISRDSTLLQARDGSWVLITSVFVVAGAVLRAESAAARPLAAVSLVFGTLSLMLSTASWTSFPLAGWILAAVALGAALLAAWVARASLAQRRSWTPLEGAVLAVLAFSTILQLAPGRASHRLDPAVPLTLVDRSVRHQGISVYDEDNAAILALALDAGPGDAPALRRAEQREVMDARGAVVGRVWTPPAQWTGWRGTTRVWLDSVRTGDIAWVTTSTDRGTWMWTALVLVLWWVAVAPAPTARGPRAGAAPGAAGQRS